LLSLSQIRFTAGDLIEGLSFLDVVCRRAVLFGLEQGLGVRDVIWMTYDRARTLRLTRLSKRVLQEMPRHITLDFVFWHELEGGAVAPLTRLESDTAAAFAGITWETLQRSYASMAWVDSEAEADDFMRVARAEGLL
jgi:hypothetical protein